MDMARTDLALQELSGLLWRERQLLDRLEYALVTEQLILASGQIRFLARSSGDVAAVLDEIRLAEVSRAMAFAGIAGELGLDELPLLRTLCTRVPAPWSDIFGAHRRALCGATTELTRLAEETRMLLTLDSRVVAAALDAVDTGEHPTLDLDQEPEALALHLAAHQVTSRCAMTVAVEVLQPTLAEFLA